MRRSHGSPHWHSAQSFAFWLQQQFVANLAVKFNFHIDGARCAAMPMFPACAHKTTYIRRSSCRYGRYLLISTFYRCVPFLWMWAEFLLCLLDYFYECSHFLRLLYDACSCFNFIANLDAFVWILNIRVKQIYTTRLVVVWVMQMQPTEPNYLSFLGDAFEGIIYSKTLALYTEQWLRNQNCFL